jgi:predicted aspartyl protease
MKVLKKIVLTILVFLILAILGGYIYFDQKFTPEKNYLTVDHESGLIPFTWLGTEKNVLLLPIHFEGDTSTYYLQFDTGSPYTVFYSKSIKNIHQIFTNQEIAKTSFYIGKTKIASDKFKIYNLVNDNNNDSLKIIGTIGADILENRKTIINFKENYIALNLSKAPPQFQTKLFDFKFKKRKIIVKGFLKGQEENFLFDSGTSAYELLTNKEVWKILKLPNSKINIEKSQSWDNVLTTYTANCNQKIQFFNHEIPLNNVTYVEGFSQVQYSMMKFSGMTGMLGNKIFLNNGLYIDCIQNKMGIE